MRDKYIIAKYLRLSLDDGDKAESDSIANQRNLIDFHIAKIFKDKVYETIELIDDGYTGTNMNRPAMKKLLILAETHGINCVIVKDFSRFARDYIEVGKYAEQKFPEWQIRFIAINDRYDSQDYIGTTGGIEVALKNITYTMYSRDLSEKIKSARRIQYRQGKFVAPYAFYGYVKDPENKGRILIDEEAATNVRRIFHMRLSGIKNAEIARKFNDEGILTPADYKKSIDPLCREWNHVSDSHCWTASIITNIIADERYTGKMISNKRERITVGSPKVKAVNKEDRIVVLNTHEPIISQDVYDAVRRIASRRKTITCSKVGLRGLVRCGGCHHKMSASGRQGENVKYTCQYKHFTENNHCVDKSIAESELADIVVDIIKNEIAKAVDMSAVEDKNSNRKRQLETEIETIYRKIADKKRKKIEYYILLTKKQIDEQEFQRRRDKINNAIAAYEQQIENLKYETVSLDKLSVTGIFNKYVGTDEINRETVVDLIKEILVYSDDRIEIVWNVKDERK